MKEIKNIKKYFIYYRSRSNYYWLKIKFMIYLSEEILELMFLIMRICIVKYKRKNNIDTLKFFFKN